MACRGYPSRPGSLPVRPSSPSQRGSNLIDLDENVGDFRAGEPVAQVHQREIDRRRLRASQSLSGIGSNAHTLISSIL